MNKKEFAKQLENAIELEGVKKGNNSVITVLVHGDETCGLEALYELFPLLEIESGKITFVLANPKAYEQNVRFAEANLNRLFKKESTYNKEELESYEFSRARFLREIYDTADVLLDIHASFTPKSEPFVICERNAENFFDYLPVQKIVFGFDEIEPGGTDYYMNSIGKIGICLECGYLGDSSSKDVAMSGIINFLYVQNHISKQVKNILEEKKEKIKKVEKVEKVERGEIIKEVGKSEKNFIQMNELYYTKTDDFKLARDFKDFEKLKKGELIGYDGEEKICASKDSIILFARNRQQVADEAFLLGYYCNENCK